MSNSAGSQKLITVQANDRIGKKVAVQCLPTDNIAKLKELIGAKVGTEPRKIVLKKGYKEFRDHISLDDCK